MRLVADVRNLQRYGLMPRGGGMLDQPARFIEALPIIWDGMNAAKTDIAKLRAAMAANRG